MRSFRIKRTPIDSDKSPTVNPLSQSYAAVSVEQPWGKVFPDQAMTLAAIDRLVHHATILEMNVESYRRKTAIERKRGRGRPAQKASIKSSSD